ncbi:MAG: hypothetical protein WAM98_17700, partial [Terriglobales bacterium]
KEPTNSDQKKKMKMMSRTEGWRKRRADELGCAGVIISEEAVYKVSALQGLTGTSKSSATRMETYLRNSETLKLLKSSTKCFPTERPFCESLQ